jgi:hypothetical protein
MTSKKLHELPPTEPLDGSEIMYLEKDGNSRKTSLADIAAWLGATVPSGSPNYATEEALAPASTSGTSIAGATITFTPKANRDYLFLWSQDISLDSTGSRALADVTIDGTTIFTNGPSIQPQGTAPADYFCMGGLFRYQAGASPAPVTAALFAGRPSLNAANVTVRNSRVSYVILGPNDVYAESLARQVLTDPGNKTLTTVATLTFTPPSAGDYIIVASFNYDLVSSTNVSFLAELTDGTTTIGGAWWRPRSLGATDYCPGMLVLPLSAVSGARTISLKVQQPNTGATTIGISEIRMIAIRADRFAHVHHTELGSDNAGTDNAYVTAQSQTFTPAPADHLTLATWALASTSIPSDAYAQYLDGAVSVGEATRKYDLAIAAGLSGVAHRIANYPATPLTQAIQRHGTSGCNNTIEKAAAIVTLDLTNI